ncbi:MAG: PUA domain-containing protein [Nitrososphaerota archaeon]
MFLEDLEALRIVRKIADYQFGRGVGEKLFPEGCVVVRSKKTGRPKYIYLDGKILATVRSSDGFMALTIHGGLRLSEILDYPKFRIVVYEKYVERILEMEIVRSRWVKIIDSEIVPNDEVMVCCQEGELVAVGKAIVSAQTISSSNNIVVAKIRHKVEKEHTHKKTV